MILWLILALTCSALLFLIGGFPEKWASLVSAENAYFVKKGWISESLAQTFAKIETGLIFQAVVALVSVFSIYNLVS